MTELTGRDLDWAVAEAKELRVEEAYGSIYAVGVVPGDFGSNIRAFELPHYSTDWAAAGPLLEEMAAAHEHDRWLAERCLQGEVIYILDHTPLHIARAYVAWKAATNAAT